MWKLGLGLSVLEISHEIAHEAHHMLQFSVNLPKIFVELAGVEHTSLTSLHLRIHMEVFFLVFVVASYYCCGAVDGHELVTLFALVQITTDESLVVLVVFHGFLLY